MKEYWLITTSGEHYYARPRTFVIDTHPAAWLASHDAQCPRRRVIVFALQITQEQHAALVAAGFGS